MKHIQLLLFSFLTLLAISCGSDKDSIVDNALACTDFVDQFNAEFGGLNNASALYISNPTKENCEGYRNSLIKYNELLRGNLDCWNALGQFSQIGRDSLIRILDEQRIEIDHIDCN